MTSLPLQTNKPILIKSNRDRLCEIFSIIATSNKWKDSYTMVTAVLFFI